MMFSLTACNSASESGGSVSAPLPLSTPGESLISSHDSSFGDTNGSTPQSEQIGSSAAESSQPEQPAITPQPQPEPVPESSKILVAYFSATNTTKGVANRISEALNADLYEIVPAVPYTSADLNYNYGGSRSSIEMNDPNSRPAISGSVSGMDKYDIVFIGYPIWWGEAPRILSTFVESSSFSGKTVVPFCTSGSSGVGSSSKNLERLTSGAQWLSGTRLSGSASKNDIVRWINGLGLDIKAE